MVLACMVLHNVCIQRKDEWSPDIADESAYEDPDRGLQRPAWMEDDDPERAPAPVPTAEERASMEGKEAESGARAGDAQHRSQARRAV